MDLSKSFGRVWHDVHKNIFTYLLGVHNIMSLSRYGQHI